MDPPRIGAARTISVGQNLQERPRPEGQYDQFGAISSGRSVQADQFGPISSGRSVRADQFGPIRSTRNGQNQAVRPDLSARGGRDRARLTRDLRRPRPLRRSPLASGHSLC